MTQENQNTQSKPAGKALSAPASSAFPVASDVNPDGNQSGMRLLEYFAARALQGILSNPDLAYNPDDAAREAVAHAECLIFILSQNHPRSHTE